ncbi:oxygenase MpaB family protein [Acidiferrimicrobium sp. IK]|uniref:oxygenase MpaB family protein n=1 Tax=Acidiferrimicrobium sp. IK TaxID=2871700 RepID=UPI0021CB00AE|nr:oxygenase MpaB family protein [Acidiferrimicrobium sp. IK]
MQLSWAPVGYGVVESKVDSGKVTLHPLKRFRTTFTYLAVALMGSEDERRTYRKAVNRSHAQVHSGPVSPVEYNAFDPELQLWVAACLYYGSLDVAVRFGGPLDDATADALYEAARPLGTTLQVKPEMWPASRAEFEEYWERALERVSIDPPVREYLYDLATLRFLPAPLRWPQSRFNLFVTTGFLPPRFREAMQLEWTDADERRFNRLIGVIAAVSRRLPSPLRHFPFNYFLWDFRTRVRLGRRLV